MRLHGNKIGDNMFYTFAMTDLGTNHTKTAKQLDYDVAMEMCNDAKSKADKVIQDETATRRVDGVVRHLELASATTRYRIQVTRNEN